VAHPEVRIVSFTGWTVTGQRVAVTAAPLFKRVGLELGGKNATVVFADVATAPGAGTVGDLFDQAVEGATRGAFANQGQVCLCGSRLFVQKDIAERFLEAMLKKVATMKCGDPRTANFGSLVSLNHRDKIERYVKLARECKTAQIHCGGKRPDNLPAPFSNGAFYEPTVITGLPTSHACSQEEIFGPVLIVHTFSTEEEVIREVNGTRYGLAGSVWTSNLTRGHRVAQAIQSGMIWVNCWLYRDLRVPFGGVKESGTGREGGRDSLDFWTESKNICVRFI